MTATRRVQTKITFPVPRSPFPKQPFLPLLRFLPLLLLLAACADPKSTPKPSNTSEPGVTRFSPNTQRLYNYLTDIYGSYTLSGQMDTSWTTNTSIDMITRVYNDTGKYPAIKGFDLIQLPFDNGREQVNEAIDWWKGQNNYAKLLSDKPDIHGIVTFCWHWKVKNSTSSVSDFRPNTTDFRIPMKDGQLDKSSAAFTKTIKPDLDKAAAALQQLKEKDIPVLWRPLHEAAGNWSATNPNGAWFWWGSSGPEAYIALWEYMYDYFTNEKGLDNLIWVWNGQNYMWVPNPATVDIVGYDWYPWPHDTPQAARNYQSQAALFNRVEAMVNDGKPRMVAMSENGAIPDPDNCKTDNAMWLWFCTWNDKTNEGKDDEENFWTGEWHNTGAHKQKVYNHDLVITLDKLPDLTKYRLE